MLTTEEGKEEGEPKKEKRRKRHRRKVEIQLTLAYSIRLFWDELERP